MILMDSGVVRSLLEGTAHEITQLVDGQAA